MIRAGSARIDVPDLTFGIPGLRSGRGEAATYREVRRMLVADLPTLASPLGN